ncbi:hypothetical protein [Thalassobacillus devorans]|uniref:hypothetical protein n=1 Tax=Thalassobacillus devorans TaxID=279813 RepID=UPI0004905695|nr:hypothetical protein [Thalassobacillus devorans]
MIDRQMVEEIVVEVLKRHMGEVEGGKPKLSVISAAAVDEQTIKVLERHWKPVVMDPSDNDVQENADQAVFLQVDQDLLVKSATGITDTDESRLFAELMLQGSDIHFVLHDKLRWIASNSEKAPNINARYKEMLIGYYEKLLDYGVSFTEVDQLGQGKIENRDDWIFKEKLLTQTILEKWQDRVIHVSTHTIVTPLARDTARERNIKIIEYEAEEVGT